MNRLTLGSLFDGSGGFPLGGLISGIVPLWASEIEPFPIRVTTKRMPQVKHLGDISKIKGDEIEPVDIITFGSPCTDMSLAGRRAGLEGKQSVLFYQAIRIVKEMREKTNGKYPRFIVWENVPGAFSSNKGEDFKEVLEAICKVKSDEFAVPMPDKGKWTNAGYIMADDFSVAWRVLDTQYWPGTPQRRRRIYLVADFRGTSVGEILFESEGLSGYNPQGCRPWEEPATRPAESIGATGRLCLNDQGGIRMDVTEDMTCTLRAESHHPPCVLEAAIALEHHPTDSRLKISGDNKVQTLTSRMGTGGNNVPLLLKIRSGCEGGGKGVLIQEDKSATISCNNDQTLFEPVAYGICSKDSNSMKSSNPNSGFYEADTARTIDGNGGNPSCNQGGIAVVSLQGSMIGRSDANGPQGSGISQNIGFTLNTVDRHVVVYALDRETFNCGKTFAKNLGISDDGINPTLNARGPSAVATSTYSASKASFFTIAEKELANTLVATDYKDPPIVNDADDVKYIVRRLTPTECAKLQGFPGWWCACLETENPTAEDLAFWREVFETHRRIVTGAGKPKTDKQLIKWLQNPHSDSAEYKMWGNGVALPNVIFVLSGIVWAVEKEQADD